MSRVSKDPKLKRNNTSASQTGGANYTEHTAAELRNRLRSQHIQNDALINSLGEGLVVISSDGNISQVNLYALEALGFAEDELAGRWYPGAIIAVDQYGHKVGPLNRPVTKALTEGQPVSDYTYFLRKDGTSMPVFLTVSPIVIDNKPSGAIEVFRDLTKERELDLAKEDFVSLASHQLRTPATGVKTILWMLHQGNFGALNEEQSKYVQMAMSSNDRQLQIIEDLLSLARADAGTLELELDYVDLAALVHNVTREHENEIQLREQVLTVSTPESAGAIADGQKIQMVLDNLVSNACKYTHHGGSVDVSLTINKYEIVIAVKDTGVGIPEDQIATAFSKFGRVDNELSAPAGGTGLGLYLAKKIITLHNGSISVVSKLGVGSVFEVTLPVNTLTLQDDHEQA